MMESKDIVVIDSRRQKVEKWKLVRSTNIEKNILDHKFLTRILIHNINDF
jgi:hypothetical protein